MPSTIEGLKALLATKQRELAAIDIEGCRRAAAERDDQQTRHRLQMATMNHGPLQREVDRLSAMIHADERIAQARQAFATSREVVDSARAAVEAADRSLAKIDEMIKAEQQAFELAKASAAASLLASIKANGDASSVRAPSLEKVATLELARVEAQHERDAVGIALAAAEKHQNQAYWRLLRAQADATERDHEFALSAYVDAAWAHQVACGKLGQGHGFYLPNVAEHVAQRHRMAGTN